MNHTQVDQRGEHEARGGDDPGGVGHAAPYDGTGAFASVLWRLWTLAQGPAHAALMVALLSADDQGRWYALAGLSKFQALVELGAGTTLLTLAARAKTPERTLGLLRLSVAWHVAAALAWLVAAGGLGTWWVASTLGAAWVLPWVALVLATALQFPTLPFVLVLEARGRVTEAYRFRMAQGVRARLAAWAALLLGFAAWAPAVERLSAATDAALWLRGRARELAGVTPDRIGFSEVWAMQWRIAASTAGGAVPFALLVPVAAHGGHGPAGQIGAALTVLGSIQQVAWSLLASVFPRVGAALGAGRRAEARADLVRGSALAGGVFVAGAAAALVCAPLVPSAYADRVPSTGVIALLAAAFAVRSAREVYVAWCRADLRPFTWPADVAEGLVCGPVLWLVPHDAASLAGAWLACAVGNAALTAGLGLTSKAAA